MKLGLIEAMVVPLVGAHEDGFQTGVSANYPYVWKYRDGIRQADIHGCLDADWSSKTGIIVSAAVSLNSLTSGDGWAASAVYQTCQAGEHTVHAVPFTGARPRTTWASGHWTARQVASA
jgi:hypothetical protein